MFGKSPIDNQQSTINNFPMALKEYRAKRNFSVSPEPAGAEPKARKKGDALFFCVQKHLASHLHYDFRLEHDGVLLSWAVPKGPSINPAVKRLAMHVEDHPIEYGTFEGVIPDGYGAGVVMLWDEGTWEPLVDDVGAALKKGDLKLKLNGVKLKGSWALIRTRGSGDGRSWLLLKHKDEWAGAIDIAAFAPLSIKSGGDFTDILSQEAPDLWTSHRAAAKGGPAHMRKVVERAIAIAEENGRHHGSRDGPTAPRPDGSTTAAPKQSATGKPATKARPAAPKRASAKAGATAAVSPARSTQRTPAATGRAARSRGARTRPR
jgi:bifunctional non-homologous end joining protein LigD